MLLRLTWCEWLSSEDLAFLTLRTTQRQNWCRRTPVGWTVRKVVASGALDRYAVSFTPLLVLEEFHMLERRCNS